MYISPEQFAQLLQKSTLTPRERNAVLDLLPILTLAQIQELSKVLLDDLKGQGEAMAKAKRKRDQILLKFDLELDQLREQPKQDGDTSKDA